MRIIRQRMAEAGEWGVRNFADTPYTNPQNGQTYSVIRMTKKGFHFVVGKFTGAKAAQHQIAFADGFERMEAELSDHSLGHTVADEPVFHVTAKELDDLVTHPAYARQHAHPPSPGEPAPAPFGCRVGRIQPHSGRGRQAGFGCRTLHARQPANGRPRRAGRRVHGAGGYATCAGVATPALLPLFKAVAGALPNVWT
jgi:Rha family phage regulatory protein